MTNGATVQNHNYNFSFPVAQCPPKPSLPREHFHGGFGRIPLRGGEGQASGGYPHISSL